MDQMSNELGDRLESQYVNDHDGLKIGLRKDNLKLGGLLGELTLMWMSLLLIIRTWVMLILKMCLWDIGNVLHNNEIICLEEKDMVIILARQVIIGTRTIS